jgi:hypothetical protein
MRTAPSSARGALLAIAASETPSDGGEQFDFCTIPGCGTGGAHQNEGQWFQLSVIPPFPSNGYVVQSSSLTVVHQGDYGGGGRGE